MQKRAMRPISIQRTMLIAFAAGAVSLVACTPRLDTRGAMLDPESIEEIKPGIHTRNEVAQRLGTPSSLATFDDKTWYYIGNKTETVAFLKPKVLEQQVIAIKFDETGTVKEVNKLDLKDGRDIQISDRVSPTRGRELGLFQQLYQTLLQGRGTAGTNEGFTR